MAPLTERLAHGRAAAALRHRVRMVGLDLERGAAAGAAAARGPEGLAPETRLCTTYLLGCTDDTTIRAGSGHRIRGRDAAFTSPPPLDQHVSDEVPGCKNDVRGGACPSIGRNKQECGDDQGDRHEH